MDENQNNLVVTPEEQNAEKEWTKEVTDEELREKVVADFGLDPEESEDLINKLVEREKDHHTKLSGAIKQKINWRTKAASTQTSEKKDGTFKEEDISKLVDQKLAERELDSLELSDDLKDEIKTLAKSKDISIRDASKLPYIQYRIAEVEKEKRLQDGTPKRTSAGGKTISIDPSKPLNSTDYDLSSEEGRKAWNEAKDERAKWRQEHQ